MVNKYSVEFADGYYITKNGVGVLDLANPDDGEFANYVVALLENAEREKRKAAQHRVHQTAGGRRSKKSKLVVPAAGNASR